MAKRRNSGQSSPRIDNQRIGSFTQQPGPAPCPGAVARVVRVEVQWKSKGIASMEPVPAKAGNEGRPACAARVAAGRAERRRWSLDSL